MEQGDTEKKEKEKEKEFFSFFVLTYATVRRKERREVCESKNEDERRRERR